MSYEDLLRELQDWAEEDSLREINLRFVDGEWFVEFFGYSGGSSHFHPVLGTAIRDALVQARGEKRPGRRAP